MIDKLRDFNDYIQHFTIGTPNPITSQLPLLGCPIPMFLITIAYLGFVLNWGPAFMENRPAYNLKNTLLAYNIFQIFTNFFLFFCFIIHIKSEPSLINDFGCCEALPEDHPRKHIELFIYYTYYLNKIIDYLDTIIFVLRKSFKQITVLHLYHHLFMVFSFYFYIRFYGSGGQMNSVVLLNTLVHGFMYTYYLTTALQLQTKRSNLWWKEYITRLQLFQFFLVFLHHFYPLLFRPNCDFPKFWLYYPVIQSAIVAGFFVNFYIKSYVKKNKKPLVNSEKSLKRK